MPAAFSGSRYLDPEALARLGNLSLAARLVVEGVYAGQHRSPRKGFSVEFAEHRQYSPGDELRHLDWKILAKRDRLYVKQYEEQTCLRGYLLLDASASMGWKHGDGISKLEYACYCAASMAYLMQRQNDAVGLVVFDTQVRRFIPPRQGRAHLRAIMECLEETRPGGETDLPAILRQLAERMKRRSLVILLSDLFSGTGGPDPLLAELGLLAHRKHEVEVMQVLDPAELSFPFHDAGQIQDVESGHLIASDAQAIRDHYLEAVQAYIRDLRRGCQARRIGWGLAETSQPFADFLIHYLTRRRERMVA